MVRRGKLIIIIIIIIIILSPCGGKHIIIAGPGCPDTSREGRLMIPPTRRIARLRLSHKLSLQVSCSPGRWPPAVARASPKHLSTSS